MENSKFTVFGCLGFLTVGLLVGCNALKQDPLEEAKQTNKLTEVRQDASNTNGGIAPYGLSVGDVLEFVEDERGEHVLEAWVPSPGQPVLTFLGLPEGAFYDKGRKRLIWKPSLDAATDPSNPAHATRLYPVKIKLESDVEPSVAPIRRDVIFLVRDHAQPINVTFPGEKVILDEGQQLLQVIKVTSADFPNGPFIFETTGLPRGVLVETSENNTRFVLHWRPWYDVVTERDPMHDLWRVRYKKFDVTYTIRTLRGVVVRSPAVKWYVKDARPQGVPQEFRHLLEVHL